MAFDYDSLVANVVIPQIRDKGRIVQVVKRVNNGSDYMPDWVETDHDVRFLPTNYSLTNRDNTVIQVGDVLGIISTETGVIPEKTNDKLKIDGEIYSFVEVKPYNYNGVTDMFYKIQARK